MLAGGDPIPVLKEQLAREIQALFGDRNPDVAARCLGIDQPRMSDLLNGKLERFSLQKLIRLLANIDRRVTLTVTNEGSSLLRLWNFKPRR